MLGPSHLANFLSMSNSCLLLNIFGKAIYMNIFSSVVVSTKNNKSLFCCIFSLPSPSVYSSRFNIWCSSSVSLPIRSRCCACSWVEQIPKVNCEDEIKGKWVITSQTELVQEMAFVLFWLQRKALRRKDSMYCDAVQTVTENRKLFLERSGARAASQLRRKTLQLFCFFWWRY